MSFTPSDKFEQRWLDSPVAMKQAIMDELSDIITLLKDDTKIADFAFSSPDLAAKLSHLQAAHLDTLKKLAQKAKAERADALIPILEQQIDHKLDIQLTQLADELKIWLRQIVQEELDKQD